MTWKKVENEDPGTADVFGGNDLDKFSDLFSGVDVDDVDINADFTVRSGKRKLRNPANTFDYIETAGAITANRIVNEPVLTATDTRVYQAHTQTLTNKTISGASNTLSNIPLNSLSTFAISAPTINQVIQYNGTSWVNATSAGGGGGGGFSAGGSITKSGDGVTSTVTIAHGLSPTPDLYFALALNAASRGSISYSIDATNITLTYPIAPAEGTNNLSYVWGAGYVNPASGGFTPTSTTTLTNKRIGDYLDFTRIAAPANPATDLGRLYHRQIDTNNDGLFMKMKKAGAIVEVQIA